MANYQESQVSGTSWVRAHKITVDNALGQNPSINFQQEKIITLDGGERFQKLVDSISETLTIENSQTEFPLIHPVTGDQIGVGTYEQFQLFLYSLYIHVTTLVPVNEELSSS